MSVFMVRCFFLLSYFLVVEDYKLCINHLVSVLLPVEYVIILSLLYISSFFWLPDDVLCKIPVWADDTTLNSTFDIASDLPLQTEIAIQLWFDLKNQICWKAFVFHQLLFDFEVSRFGTQSYLFKLKL